MSAPDSSKREDAPAEKSAWEKDLDKLERVTYQQGYNRSVEDLEGVLLNAIKGASPETVMMIFKIQDKMHKMAAMRFPNETQIN